MSEKVKTKRTKTSKKASTSSKTSKKASKKAAVAVAVETPEVAPEVVPDVAEVVEETPVVEDEVVVPPSTKRIVNSQTVDLAFETFLKNLEEHMELTRADRKRDLTIKDWQALYKEAKRLRTDVQRVTKLKRKGNSNGGITKPVQVSKEIAKFAGWAPEELHSRVDVSRVINAYIKEKQLQNPEYRREIFPDKKLTKLLKYNKEEHGPLLYQNIMQRIGHHFPKSE